MEKKVKINGTPWTFKLVTEKEMRKHRGKNQDPAGGLCVVDDKTIYVDYDCVDYKTIAHELFHAYVSDLHLDDTNTVPLSDIEEIFAGLFTAKGEKMTRQAKKIVKDLQKLMEEDSD